MSHDELSDLLSRALRNEEVARTSDDAVHLDEATLAEYLDGELAATEREAAEEHLAGCPQCRELAVEAAAALRSGAAISEKPGPNRVLRPDPLRWRDRWQAPAALAAALVLAAATAVLFTRLAALPNLENVGVTIAELDAAGLPVRQAVRRGLTGRLREIEGLPARDALADDIVVRGRTATGPPVPLEPRWNTVEDATPRLRWRGDPSASGWEVLVIDEQENLVAAFEAESLPGQEVVEARLPEPAKLDSGVVYLWKVNERFEDRLEASPWVPFRVLDSREQAALASKLDAAGDDPFLRAAVFAAWGVDGAALEELGRIPAIESGDDPRGTFARALLERHQLPESEIERELARLGGA